MIDTTIRRARLAGRLTRTHGPGWMIYRAKHAVQLKTGLVERRLPAMTWEEAPLAGELTSSALAEPDAYLAYRTRQAPAFFFAPGDREAFAPLLRAWDTSGVNPIRDADDLKAGVFRFFSRTSAELGQSPAWQRNAFTGQEAPGDRHWSRLDDFASGDIKVIWEPSRFAFTYDLVRAYWRTGDESYAERFWYLVESWREGNPPQRGPNWKCGQETSFRVMAWCFGLYGFLDAPTSTTARVTMLAEMIALSGHRIEAMVEYALSQQNNHGVSEGMGLWTIGSLFPEFNRAAIWRERGCKILERLGQELIYEDGAFSQHSLNYHRLMLHDYLWSMRLGEIHNSPFSQALYERIGKSVDLLYQLQDEVTGQVPCYGANDGALILPLSNSDYLDYRPVIQATRFLTTHVRAYDTGPWDEDLIWLFGLVAVTTRVDKPNRHDFKTPDGGYVVLRSTHGHSFTRCASFRHRPSHADLLHVDVWWRGINVALDPGTYSYNALAAEDGSFASTANHNTVSVDNFDQMEKAGRFLWLPWATGSSVYDKASPNGSFAYWEGQHHGYDRLLAPVSHRRGMLRIGSDHWLVVDELRSLAPHEYRLHWLLPDFPYCLQDSLPASDQTQQELQLSTPEGLYSVTVGSLGSFGQFSVVQADKRGSRGWRASYYHNREPALSLALEVRGTAARLWTLLGPAGVSVKATKGTIKLCGSIENANISLGPNASSPLVMEARTIGLPADVLRVAP